MIITCPACDAQYLLPDDSIGPKGRRVKCTSCAYTWLQPLPAAEDEENIVAAKEFTFDPEKNTRRDMVAPHSGIATPVASTSWGTVIGRGISIAVFMLVVTFGFLILFRDIAVAKWQPMALFYDTVGLKVAAPGIGISIEKVTASLNEETGLLILKGNLSNNSKQNKVLPKLLVRLSGANGWLKDWSIDLYDKTVSPGRLLPFEYGLKGAPKEGREATLRFAD